MTIPIGPLIQGASEARNAFVGGRRQRDDDQLATAMQLLKLKREQEEQGLRDAFMKAQTSKLLQPPAPPRDYVREHQLNRDYDNANPAPMKPTTPQEPDLAARLQKRIEGLVATGIPLKKASEQARLEYGQAPPMEPTQIIADKANPTGPGVVVPRSQAIGSHVPTTVRESQPRPPNEFSSKAALVYDRAAQAARTLDPFYEKGAPITSTAGQIPIVGNYMLSDDEQRMNQAAETVATAILRLESGAAVSVQEARSYAKQFLPQPGDGPDVRAQKRAALHTQLERIRIAAEPANSAPNGSAPTTPGGGRGGGGNRQPLTNRVQQLKAQGVSKEEARRILQQEGYNLNGVPQ